MRWWLTDTSPGRGASRDRQPAWRFVRCRCGASIQRGAVRSLQQSNDTSASSSCLSRARSALTDLLIPRQDGVDPGDERSEVFHVLPQELLGRLVRDAAIIGDQALFELDIGLDGIHQRRVAEGENAPQVLLGDGRADFSRRYANDA